MNIEDQYQLLLVDEKINIYNINSWYRMSMSTTARWQRISIYTSSILDTEYQVDMKSR